MWTKQALLFSFVSVVSVVLSSSSCLRADDATPAGKGISGLWSGLLDTDNLKLKVVFQFSQRTDGSIRSQTHIFSPVRPAQGSWGIPTDVMSYRDGEIKLRLKGATFTGRLGPDGNRFEGEWKWTPPSKGQALPLTVQQVAEVPELIRLQDPVKPYPYSEEEVSFLNPRAGVKIVGVLTHPAGGGPFPTVILCPAGDRNAEQVGHHPFLVLADYLTRQGLAVLRTDDRGIGGSTGDAEKGTSEDRVGDTLSALAYLKTRNDMAGKFGLIGYGQSGAAAPLVAARSKDVAFVVLMAVPGITGQQLMTLQAFSLPVAFGQEKEGRITVLNAQAEIADIVNEEQDVATTEKKLREVLTRLTYSHTPRPTNPGPEADAFDAGAFDNEVMASVERQLKPMLMPEYRFQWKYDPQITLRQVQCPILAINGELDPYIPAKQNLRGIETALKAGGNQDYIVQALPKINHLFQTAEAGSPQEMGKITETIAPSVLKLVGDWIQQHAVQQHVAAVQ